MIHGHPECFVCTGPVPDYVPDMCCSGHECGCYGQPIEPPICGDICWDFANSPTLQTGPNKWENFEDKKKRLGFKDWKPNVARFMED